MWEAVRSNVVLPQLTRLGSVAAGILIGAGVESGHATLIGTALPVMALVAVDYTLAWFRKRSIQRKATAQALGA